MRIFSKIVFICNVCFIIAAVLRFIEVSRHAKGNADGILPFQPLTATIVILGYGAIFINLVFFIIAGIFFKRPAVRSISRKLLLFNLIVFPLQVWYFFFT
jgi:hypothetical protein